MTTSQILSVQRVQSLGPPLSILPGCLPRLSREAQERMRKNSALVRVSKGQLLIRAGDIFRHCLFVQNGWIAGDIEGVTVTLLSSGSYYLVFAGDTPRPAPNDLRALTSGSIAVLDRDTLWDVLKEEPEMLVGMLDKMTDTLNQLNTDLARRLTQPLELRLASFLWDMGSPTASGGRKAPSGVPQAEIASFLGASREEISRKKALLVKAGYLQKREGEWVMDCEPKLALY